MCNDSDEMIHSNQLLNHLIVFLKDSSKSFNTLKEFVWENSYANLNTLKRKFGDVTQFLATNKMPSACHFLLHIIYLWADMLACELSSESIVHNHNT